MAHQVESLKHDLRTPIVFDVSDPGTGKTFTRIRAFSNRRRKGAGPALIVAPKTLLESAWAEDFQKFEPGIVTSVARAENRDAAFAADADAYITNHDAVKWLAKQPKSFFARFSELIVDESTAFKHHTSQRSKALAQIAPHFEHRSCLTGTPNGRSITDVWHQAFLLDRGRRLGPSFYGFRNSTCTPVQRGRNKDAIEWIDRDGAEEAVFDLLSDITIRHRFEACVDIPANHRYTRHYHLSRKHLKTYQELEATHLLRLKGKELTAINAAAVATKLLQLASGAVYTDDTDFTLVDTGRYEAVLDLVEERAHSLVMFQWKHQRNALIDEATRRGLTFCVIDGDTTDAERKNYVQAYQMGAYRVMFAHPRSAGHGLTLTRGSTTIWASPTYDLELFEQGSRRQYRIGQTQKTETITLVATGTIDEKVVQILEGKNKRMQHLLDLFAS